VAKRKEAPKSHKSANFIWLCTIVTFDVVVLSLIIFPNFVNEVAVNNLTLLRSVNSALLPVVPLLLTNSVPSTMKARLVFWRWNDPNPGARAFSQYIQNDDRIDIEKLRDNVGEFPVTARDQNSFWYSLYKKIENEVAVADAHKSFLLYRDMASMSLLLLAITLAVMGAWQFGWADIGKAMAVFLVQYLLTAISARTAGERFVCTVLSIHSTKKIP